VRGKQGLERVYMVWDIYDGVRSGIASYRGALTTA
jgi:hypothetical protein